MNLSTGIVGEQLRAPYGQARYGANATGSTGGGMRTPFGFTGQREDTSPAGSSGLDYFNARYYDAETGRFTSADDAQPGLGDPSGQDNYAYVGGMVENATDPSGQEEDLLLDEVRGEGRIGTTAGGDSGGGGGGGGGGGFGLGSGEALAESADQYVRAQSRAYAADNTTAGTTPTSAVPPEGPPRGQAGGLWPQTTPAVGGNAGGLGPEGVFTQGSYAAAMQAPYDAPRNRASPEPTPAPPPTKHPKPTPTSPTQSGGSAGNPPPGGPPPPTSGPPDDSWEHGPNCGCPLQGWQRHTEHFFRQWQARGSLSIESMNRILSHDVLDEELSGQALRDLSTRRFGYAGNIDGAWYTIWYTPNDLVLRTIQGVEDGGYYPSEIRKMSERWTWQDPDYQSPFC